MTMNPNGKDERRSADRLEWEALKNRVLRRTAELDPNNPDHKKAIRICREMAQEQAARLGIELPKAVSPDDDTKVIERRA
jgi:hypothetical protein